MQEVLQDHGLALAEGDEHDILDVDSASVMPARAIPTPKTPSVTRSTHPKTTSTKPTPSKQAALEGLGHLIGFIVQQGVINTTVLRALERLEDKTKAMRA